MPTKPYLTLKHTFDFLGALLLLVLLGPLLLLLALAIRLDSRGPAVYLQTRVGRKGSPFTIYKFRTMHIDAPTLSTEEMQAQKVIPFTRLGPFLRKSNFDELPQLFNILKGEMSFIGPRPALPSQTDVNELRVAKGADVCRPGITGLAQVTGRDDLDTVTKVACDATYCQRLSIAHDMQILLRTFGAILTARGNK